MIPEHKVEISPKIHPSWLEVLKQEFDNQSFIELKQFLVQQRSKGKTIYPPGNQIFSAFDHTPFDELSVVLLGQDPYHGPGQANGLCFSVAPGNKLPPSLVNIFKELSEDLGVDNNRNGDLSPWARQGVLLLNATLTVEARTPGSHQNKGWEEFTDGVIRKISQEKENVIFLLWGRYAQQKEILIDSNKHRILKAAHPSPFSAYKGFLGCKHFSKVNEILVGLKKTKIDWRTDG
jgi:uracil-DNA glycosylase